jgi:hypothetical protein
VTIDRGSSEMREMAAASCGDQNGADRSVRRPTDPDVLPSEPDAALAARLDEAFQFEPYEGGAFWLARTETHPAGG